MKYIAILLSLFLLLSCTSIQQVKAQKKKGQLEGLLYFDEDATIQYYQQYINYLIDINNRLDIESINGHTIWYVPIDRKYKKKERLRLINGYLCQYKYKANKNIELLKIKCKAIKFDFTTNEIDTVNLNEDILCFDTPDTSILKIKVKEKDEKEKKKPK